MKILNLKNSGDLDEHNGRFCITPEYPNGVYAYFTTINPEEIQILMVHLRDYFQPEFPYVIGTSFYSEANTHLIIVIESNQEGLWS